MEIKMENKNNSKKKSGLLLAGLLLLMIVAGLGIGLMLSKYVGDFAVDDKPIWQQWFGGAGETELTSNHILDATVTGLWIDERKDDKQYGPVKSYDNDKESRWNPAACTDYMGEPAIVYLLDGYYNVDTWEMIYTVRESFFDMYVSQDGKDFKLIKQVTEENYKEVYNGDEDALVCTLDKLEAKGVAFIKIIFTGSNSENNNNWLSLNAVRCMGKRLGDGPDEMPEFDDPYKVTAMEVDSYELIGDWSNDQTNTKGLAPEMTYDGNIYSSWNPEAKPGFKGEPGIIYKLCNAQDVQKMQLYFGRHKLLFDVYVSQDGVEYSRVAKISYANEDEAYTIDENEAYICTLDGLSLKDIQYIKIIFREREDGGNWALFNELILY